METPSASVLRNSTSLSFKRLLTQLEMLKDKDELIALGLSEEEIEGYFEFYLENYLEINDAAI
jgi:hypothetical protein